jgi:hypothetical protein
LTPRTSASVRSARLLSVMEPSTFVGPTHIHRAGKNGLLFRLYMRYAYAMGETGAVQTRVKIRACCRIERVGEAGSGRTSLAVHAGVGGLVVVEAHRVRHRAVQAGAVALHAHNGERGQARDTPLHRGVRWVSG